MSVEINQLVLNWHLTEACNYECQYCYAKWGTDDNRKNIISKPQSREKLLIELYNFFRPNNDKNVLKAELSWAGIRLNLAGGEPLIYDKWLPDTAKQASMLGMDVSLITNGSRLTSPAFERLVPYLTMLGISIDSIRDSTNLLIGRKSRHGKLLDLDEVRQLLITAKHVNPRLRLKINTVINALNWHEDMTALITDLSPEKWKVLKMLPVVDERLRITDSEFSQFISRHRALSSIMYSEDGTDMRESYIMIDPYGRFYQNNSNGLGYNYSSPILEVGAAAAFNQLVFNAQKFCNRYSAISDRANYEIQL